MVLKAVNLFVGFTSTLAKQNFRVLENRGIDRNKPERLKDSLQSGHKRSFGYLLLRERVTEALENLGLNKRIHVAEFSQKPKPCKAPVNVLDPI
jgi:hypothetical protein